MSGVDDPENARGLRLSTRTMDRYPTQVDRGSDRFQRNRAGMLARLAEIDAQLALARARGGDKYVARHAARGRLLARERIGLLLDRDSPHRRVYA